MMTEVNHETLGNITFDDESFQIKNIKIPIISESKYILSNIKSKDANEPNIYKKYKQKYQEYLRSIGATIDNDGQASIDVLAYIGSETDGKKIKIPEANHYIGMFMDTNIRSMPDISKIKGPCDYMFAGSGIRHIVIPENIKTVHFGMFKGCYAATDISISHNATVQTNAFSELFVGRITAPNISCQDDAFADTCIVIQSERILRKYIIVPQPILENLEIINVENISKSALNDMFSTKEKLDPNDMHSFLKGFSILTKNLGIDDTDKETMIENKLRMAAYSVIMGSYISENNLYMQDYLSAIEDYKNTVKNNSTDALRLAARVTDLIDQKDRNDAVKAFEKMLSEFYKITDEINQENIDKNIEYLEARADIAATQPILQNIIKNDASEIKSNNYLKNELTRTLLDEIFGSCDENEQDISELKNLRKT